MAAPQNVTNILCKIVITATGNDLFESKWFIAIDDVLRGVRMSSVIICEKPSQAQRIRKVIGEEYGKVLLARGHLLRLEEPGEVRPDWQKWTEEVLVPPGGRYRFVPAHDNGKVKLLEQIGAVLATATRVVIATDSDREGQLIGEAIIRHFGFSGEIMRAWWKTEDELAFRSAFANLKPNANYRPLFDSGMARVQVDQIYNLTLTRVATIKLRPPGWKSALGIGRVKTPTLGIVCKRELEIRNFVSRDFFEISATLNTAGGSVTLWHRPRGEARLFSRELADDICAAALSWQGPIAVFSERKRTLPPKPLDLTTLQKLGGPWGWSAAKVLNVAQALYETHALITYPRAESRYLPENLAGEAPVLLKGLAALEPYKAIAPQEPVIRKGKSGSYCDAGLNGEPHHAIIPNINVIHEFGERCARLNADERKVFDTIARGWLAAVAPEHEFDETVAEIIIPSGRNAYRFGVKSSVVVTPGWRAVSAVAAEEEADSEPVDAEDRPLPAIANGTVVSVDEARVQVRTTEPPKRYTEAELPSAMKAAWKFVDDPEERERLKEANGIGTAATRASIVQGLIRQKFLEIAKGKIVPTGIGLSFYEILLAGAPELVNPAATARLEEKLNAIYRGQAEADTVIAECIERTTQLATGLKSANVTNRAAAISKVKRPPTPAMIKAATAKAKREGMCLSKEIAQSFDACRAYLGPLKPERLGPSEKQIAFATKLARERDLELSREAMADGRKLAEWIDQAKKSRWQRRASPKQMEWITRLVGDGATPPKGFPDAMAASEAKKFLDQAFGSKPQMLTKRPRRK
ncbi:DNA topoisomerase III [Brucella intermedia]|uniref:DNA topoisomerase n=1 Tax=Brucella TaxID=234 RepID=UPI00094658D3|nr:DNA topoisomerase [Brucella intermedia]